MAEAPNAVLFACNLNRVRSPMAAALLRRRLGGRTVVDSCGLDPGDSIDPFAAAVMSELGLDLAGHEPKGFGTLRGGEFDLVISLTAEAHARAASLADRRRVLFEYWPTEDPTLETGSRSQRLDAYRRVRDALDRRLAERFAPASAGS